VTATGWIWGIAYSVLASLIGGASKLSIRKSWLIHERTKRRVSSTRGETERYDEVPSPRASIRRDDSFVSPLEVGQAAGAGDPPGDHRGEQRHQTMGSITDRLGTTRVSWALYISGMVGMSFLNPLCCVLAMRYANPSILAPFSGLTLVWVVLFSGRAVGEHPGTSQKLACSLIVLGEVLVAWFGDHTNQSDASVEDVIGSYREPDFHVFILLMGLLFAQFFIFIKVYPHRTTLRKCSWGCVGGCITGFQNFLKDSLTIANATKRSGGTLPGLFWLFVLMAMATAFVGLLCLAACMKRYDATYSSSMFVVSFVISASIMSWVHYDTLDHLNGAINLLMYPVGLATLFSGAFILVRPDLVYFLEKYDTTTRDGDDSSVPGPLKKGNSFQELLIRR